MSDELKDILTKFSESGWNLIAIDSSDYLNGNGNKFKLIETLKEADKQCGSCGCEFDPLYKRALLLLQTE